MKSAYVNNGPARLMEVYAPALREKLKAEADLSETVYTKEYVLANKNLFVQTKRILDFLSSLPQ